MEDFTPAQKMEIERMIAQAIKDHNHDGVLTQQNEIIDLVGMVEEVSAVPTAVPRSFYEQFKVYSNAGTYRFYWYDFTSAAWRYATGT